MTLVDSLLENAGKASVVKPGPGWRFLGPAREIPTLGKASFEALSLPLSLQKQYEDNNPKKVISNFKIDKQIASIMVLIGISSIKKSFL